MDKKTIKECFDEHHLDGYEKLDLYNPETYRRRSRKRGIARHSGKGSKGNAVSNTWLRCQSCRYIKVGNV